MGKMVAGETGIKTVSQDRGSELRELERKRENFLIDLHQLTDPVREGVVSLEGIARMYDAMSGLVWCCDEICLRDEGRPQKTLAEIVDDMVDSASDVMSQAMIAKRLFDNGVPINPASGVRWYALFAATAAERVSRRFEDNAALQNLSRAAETSGSPETREDAFRPLPA